MIFFRKIVKDGGRAIGLLGKEIQKFAESGGACRRKAALFTALGNLNGIISILIAHAMESEEDPEKIYVVGLNTSRCLMAVGDIITAWLLLRQADIAAEKLPNAGKDSDFYTGKIASAKFFVTNFLHKSLQIVSLLRQLMVQSWIFQKAPSKSVLLAGCLAKFKGEIFTLTGRFSLPSTASSQVSPHQWIFHLCA